MTSSGHTTLAEPAEGLRGAASGGTPLPALWQRLTHLVGERIDRICPNGFDDPSVSHCAHFVSHALGFGFGCTCRDLAGGFGPGANVRVHEIFHRCARIEPWQKHRGKGDCLIFVAQPDAFNVAEKTLLNIPKKHIGVLCNEWVFHYSNRHGTVLMQKVEKFLASFEEAYAEEQALFCGYMEEGVAAGDAIPK